MLTTDLTDALADPSTASEIVVAIPHQAAVVAALRALGREAYVADESTDLGLALVSFPSQSDDRNLLKTLYDGFERAHDNWVPTMGRNRVVSSVVGAGEISCGGNGVPQRIDPPVRWPRPRSGAGRGVRVCVLDTAVDGAAREGSAWVDDRSDLLSQPLGQRTVAQAHSTFVTGLILSQAPGATVEVRQVLGPDGSADSWSVAKEIARCGEEGFDVLNLSFACRTDDGKPPLALATAIARVSPRTVVVAAAGNHGPEAWPAWPAALDGVIAVGATASNGDVAPFTPVNVPWIDVYTQGMDVASTFVSGPVTVPGNGVDQPVSWTQTVTFDGFARWSGTSFSAALLSGAIAAGARPGATPAHASYERLIQRSRASGTKNMPLVDGVPMPLVDLQLLD